MNYDQLQKEAEYILSLEDDFDDEGSKKYKKEIVNNSINIIKEISLQLFNKFNLELRNPHLYPASEGSIDILFKSYHFELLINVPENTNTLISYYGDDRNYKDQIKNSLIGDFKEIVDWLARQITKKNS